MGGNVSPASFSPCLPRGGWWWALCVLCAASLDSGVVMSKNNGEPAVMRAASLDSGEEDDERDAWWCRWCRWCQVPVVPVVPVEKNNGEPAVMRAASLDSGVKDDGIRPIFFLFWLESESPGCPPEAAGRPGKGDGVGCVVESRESTTRSEFRNDRQIANSAWRVGRKGVEDRQGGAELT